MRHQRFLSVYIIDLKFVTPTIVCFYRGASAREPALEEAAGSSGNSGQPGAGSLQTK
jgi:hypothetical protein